MRDLPNVTVVAVTTKDYGPTIEAIHKTLQHIKPAEVLFFSDVMYFSEEFKCIVIPRFKSVEDYNYYIFKEVGKFINTSHLLIIQHDGYVINADAWSDEFMQYDYIGAPWTYTDGRNVGNGGFSLRSAWLHKVLQDDEFQFYSPEDEKICRYYRQTLELRYGLKFAPEAVAHKFSFEMHRPIQPTFGFHQNYHSPYREPIIIKRHGAMGDVVMLEPVLEALYIKGYRVILDTQVGYFNLFTHQEYPVELLEHIYASEDTSGYRVINLDSAYEVEPKQLALKSYAKACGVDINPRNPKLNFRGSMPMFDNYIVLHTDDTAMAHRNVHGVDWDDIAHALQQKGYIVLRVGLGNGRGGQKVNTYGEGMLSWIIAGAKYFIGLDSGCAQIAVACGVKSVIFFGSVNPNFRYHSLENIRVIQNLCPVREDGCYHSVISTIGTDCVVNKEKPPCITHDTFKVMDQINEFIQ